MFDNFLRVAAATPKIKVADPGYNLSQALGQIREAYDRGAKIIVLPELVLSGYTSGDLLLQSTLVEGCMEALRELAAATAKMDAVIALGLPVEKNARLYNAAAVLNKGKVLGFVPKKHLPGYGEFGEGRYFAAGNDISTEMIFRDKSGESYPVPFGCNLLFACESIPELVIGAELCADVWAPCPPSISHALAGATVILNCSASNETTGKNDYRRQLVTGQSARLVCGYVVANAGEGESTQDLVFSGHNMIAENGTVLAESALFGTGIIYGDLDLERIRSERRRLGSFPADGAEHKIVSFKMKRVALELERVIEQSPFIPTDPAARAKRFEEILTIQALGLKKRLEHTNCKSAVIGISGGLDSTLALLIIAKTFDLLGMPRSGITSVTMPGFGTTDRTYTNACTLTKKLGAELREVSIRDAVTVHFKDIGHDIAVKNVTYENAQARERTQILMDIANMTNGMVIGTGDLSELALGWATYNGDHMSMYGVNGGIPKTLMRHLVRYYADTCGEPELKAVLYDVLDTPVSPELLPPEEDGKIAQKTEDLVGPYELHDFFLYYILRYGYRPARIYRMAKHAFAGQYDDQTIYKWMRTFYWRFFAQQFKRSCLPDGPKVGSVGVSPRGDLRMPSDASPALWMKELDALKPEE
ncbi:MAG: NAD(+) synthase [Lachnospiraceae bacterium]|nr:NAD(+) synthase [Lachnospiraceae bacterium]